MSKDRVVEDYRQHKLLSTFHEGKYKGLVRKDKELLSEIEGDGIESVLQSLRDFVDARFVTIAENRTQDPESSEYVKAFRAIRSGLSDGHFAMLKAHYLAPNRGITATQLSEAAGYLHYGAANLQYGIVGKKIYEELPTKLLVRKDGTLIYTSALATAGDQDGDEGYWVWKMRPQVAAAIEVLGLNT
jgi:hypothetical protein